ncbi:protein of unknown function [Cupriavidus neocaledonicus]|uniref:Uncharacterized protein n=1 Tax=Cupriavidus neocaledonicus TaxID=1040979 RepID=A0A375H9M5_9BURK|nr:hypothetical protein CBM2605_A230234 [Cupriavidus neocaledonicus]SPD47945.1 protein of unknown function [Cupriavidus neocaledonicus]
MSFVGFQTGHFPELVWAGTGRWHKFH